MLEIHAGEKGSFPSLADTDLIYFGDDFLIADYGDSVQKYLGLTPPHPLGPPDGPPRPWQTMRFILCYPLRLHFLHSFRHSRLTIIFRTHSF